MSSAYERLRAVARAEGGAYIIAPDSADPWPQEIWDRVDLGVVEENMAREAAERNTATPEQLKIGELGSGIYFTPEQLMLMSRLGEKLITLP